MFTLALQLTFRRSRRLHRLAGMLLLVALAAAPVVAAEPFAPLAVALCDFATEGLEPSVGAASAQVLRGALAGNPLLDLKQSERVQRVLQDAAPAVLAARPEAAQAVYQALGARVLVYGLLWADSEGATRLQMWGVDCRPRTARLYATGALPWPAQAAAQQSTLLSALQAVLPPVGRVLAVIRDSGQTSLQLFPFAGVPLKGGTLYATYRAVARPEEGAVEFVPPLVAGEYSGQALTAAAGEDGVILASPQGAARPEIGDLVRVPLAEEVLSLPASGYLLVTDPMRAQVRAGERVLGYTPLLVDGAPVDGELSVTRVDYAEQRWSPPASATSTGARLVLKELPALATLQVTTEPAGATVLLDGQELGQTPLTRENVPSGAHTVAARLAGYVTAQQ